MPRIRRLLLLLALLGVSAARAAEPLHCSGDLYLEVDPAREAALARDFPGLAIRELLPRPLLEKLGLPDWRRARPVAPDEDLLPRLLKHPAVRRAERVPLLRCDAWSADDPGLRAQWHLERIQAPAAWRRRQGAPEVIVAIVDTGVDWHHEDLAEHIRVNPGEDIDGDGRWTAADLNMADDDQDGYIDDGVGWDLVDLPPSALWPGEDGAPADNDPDDFNGHGTHCAGDAAAAGFNGLGVASPAPRAAILPIRAGYTGTDGMGYVSHGLEGMLLAGAMGAAVVSMSFGGPGFSAMWQDAVNALHAQHVVLLAAAGNESSTTPSYPAAFAHMIAVGATDEEDGRAGFSNHGTWVDIGAPGVNILSTARDNAYALMSGTSMSTPVTAGAAALLKTAHPDWTGDQVLARLQASADPLPGQDLGAGRINIGRALEDEAWVEGLGAAQSGRLAQGQPGLLRVAVHAGALPIADGVLSLASHDPLLQLENPPLAVGFLPPGASDTLAVQATWSGEGVADLTLAGELWDGPELFWRGALPAPCGVTQLLLVEGDSSDNWSLLGWYVEALTSLGRAAEVHRLAWESPAELPWSRAAQVLLFTGSDLEPLFAPGLEDSLRAFLARGGRAVLSGQRLAQALSPAFLAEVAGASVSAAEPGSVQVWGAAGQPDVAGLHLLLTGSGGAANQTEPQQLEEAGGTALFSWSAAEMRPAAIRAADGRLDLLAFGLEAVNGDPVWGAGLDEVLGVLLPLETAVAPPPRRPEAGAVFSCRPNPFNPALQVRNEGAGELELAVYNLAGQLVERLGRARPGESLTWRPAGVAGGVYLVEGRRGIGRGLETRSLQRVLWLP